MYSDTRHKSPLVSWRFEKCARFCLFVCIVEPTWIDGRENIKYIYRGFCEVNASTSVRVVQHINGRKSSNSRRLILKTSGIRRGMFCLILFRCGWMTHSTLYWNLCSHPITSTSDELWSKKAKGFRHFWACEVMFANWRLCTEQQNDNVQFQREFRWLFITDGRSHEACGAALAREKLLVLLSDKKILSNFCAKKFQRYAGINYHKLHWSPNVSGNKNCCFYTCLESVGFISTGYD